MLISMVYSVLIMALIPKEYVASARVGVSGDADDLVSRLQSATVLSELDLPSTWDWELETVVVILSGICSAEVEEEGNAVKLEVQYPIRNDAELIVQEWANACYRVEKREFDRKLKGEEIRLQGELQGMKDLVEESLRDLKDQSALAGARINEESSISRDGFDRFVSSLTDEERARKSELIESFARARKLYDQRVTDLELHQKELLAVTRDAPDLPSPFLSYQTLATREISEFENIGVKLTSASGWGGCLACLFASWSTFFFGVMPKKTKGYGGAQMTLVIFGSHPKKTASSIRENAVLVLMSCSLLVFGDPEELLVEIRTQVRESEGRSFTLRRNAIIDVGSKIEEIG